ncbi:hypothetical protein PVAND_012085 [Polypedilum vanderplanki]|uniref:RNA methyltransferase n=1 Tax=Polypedilum vanderplanki TaxID=319348 RepID=A0A9J6CLC2_POLVA|nr:hypothetical protein PVAND_012085 [Polypedilum vanderplanki]
MVYLKDELENSPEMDKPPKKKFKTDKDNFRYGNYRNYYFKRFGAESKTDIRLEIMQYHSEYFKDKQILDIGCNSGLVTINFAKLLQPKSVLAIDIDANLIDMARKNLQKEKANFNLPEEQLAALNRIIFRKANYILTDRTLIEHERPQYEAILCLSVTKWIHLNFGDDGIKFLFKRIYKQLHQNGVLILEPQPFSGYKKRSKLNAEILENYKAIKLKPEQFEAYLLSDEIGFSESWCMTDSEILEQSNLPKGFHRPLQVFVKR